MQKRAIENPKIEMLWNSAVVEALGGEGLEQIKVKNLLTGAENLLECAGLFFAVGHEPNTGFLGGQIELQANSLAITRTSMALIGFSFTALQFLQRQHELTPATKAIALSLVLIGFTCQVLGIWQHVDFMRELKVETDKLVSRNLLAEHPRAARSMTLSVALALLLVGLAATIAVIVQIAA